MRITNSHSGGNKGGGGGASLVSCKVKKVILDPNTQLAVQYGGHDAVGMIFFNIIKPKIDDAAGNPDYRDKENVAQWDGVAWPLFPHIKYIPLINEIVTVITLVDKEYYGKRNSNKHYYFSPLNIWNHPHHNILPAIKNYVPAGKITKAQNYNHKGLQRETPENGSDINIPFGKYFKEQTAINPLLPYEGDHILEGRFGNSIRFGSTSKGNKDYKFQTSSLNPWSLGGATSTGDPITIIRNGQPKIKDIEDKPGWEHIIEDINLDPSSIYLTSTQNIENFYVAAGMCWYSFGNNVQLKQNPNKEAGKIVGDTSKVFADTQEGTPEDTQEGTPKEKATTPPPPVSGSTDTPTSGSISEDEAGLGDPKKEYYQLDNGQTEPEIIERPPLNSSYRLASVSPISKPGIEGIISCFNCIHANENQCNKFNAKIRANHEHPWVCDSWEPKSAPTKDLPPGDYQIRFKEPKTENELRSYGEITLRNEGDKIFIDVMFNMMGADTLISKGTMGGTHEEWHLHEGSGTVIDEGISNLKQKNQLAGKIEQGPRYTEDQIKNHLLHLEDLNKDKTIKFPSDGNNYGKITSTNNPDKLGVKIYASQFVYPDKNEFGNPKYQTIHIEAIEFGGQTSPQIPADRNPYEFLHTMLSGFLPEIIGEPKGTITVSFDDNSINNEIINVGGSSIISTIDATPTEKHPNAVLVEPNRGYYHKEIGPFNQITVKDDDMNILYKGDKSSGSVEELIAEAKIALTIY